MSLENPIRITRTIDHCLNLTGRSPLQDQQLGAKMLWLVGFQGSIVLLKLVGSGVYGDCILAYLKPYSIYLRGTILQLGWMTNAALYCERVLGLELFRTFLLAIYDDHTAFQTSGLLKARGCIFGPFGAIRMKFGDWVQA